MDIWEVFMARININDDLQSLIDILHNNNVDLWDFPIYKGLAYVVICASRKSSYFEYIENLKQKLSGEEWKVEFLNAIVCSMKEDPRVPAYDRERMPLCTGLNDILDVIEMVHRNNNAMMYAADVATDLYDRHIKQLKEHRKETIISFLEARVDDANAIYRHMSQYEHLLRSFYGYISNKPSGKAIICPDIVQQLHEALQQEEWKLYLLWLEFDDDDEAFETNAYDMFKKIRERQKREKIAKLKIVHSIAYSGAFTDFTVVGMFDKETACEMGCLDFEYDPREWTTDIKLHEDVTRFIDNCMVDMCIDYEFFGTCNGATFKIDLSKL